MPLERLEGFDDHVASLLQQWNAPAVGVAVVVGDTPVLTRGYGFRDYDKRLPFDASTLFPIASNTKLFVALAAGMLVDEGKLTFDKPLCQHLPELRFHDDMQRVIACFAWHPRRARPSSSPSATDSSSRSIR